MAFCKIRGRNIYSFQVGEKYQVRGLEKYFGRRDENLYIEVTATNGVVLKGKTVTVEGFISGTFEVKFYENWSWYEEYITVGELLSETCACNARFTMDKDFWGGKLREGAA